MEQEQTVKSPFGFSDAKLRFVENMVEQENFTTGVINSLNDINFLMNDPSRELTPKEVEFSTSISKYLEQVNKYAGKVHFKVCTIEEYELEVAKYFPNNEFAKKLVNTFKSTTPELYTKLCGRLNSLISSDAGVHSIEDYYAIRSGLYITK